MTETQSLISGTAAGQIFHSTVPLSFWGGIDLQSGVILDRSHPLCGRCIKGQVLAIPSGRGSCTGSAALLELLYRGTGPSALIFEVADPILTLGVNVARKLFQLSIPVIVVGPDTFETLSTFCYAEIDDTALVVTKNHDETRHYHLLTRTIGKELDLSPVDRSMLAGASGIAAQYAMELIVDFAKVQGATSLISVSRAHIDACIYTGPAILSFAQNLAAMNGRFVIPTTLNAMSVDQRRWRAQGIEKHVGDRAQALVNAYLSMEAQSSFTCAPYSLNGIPQKDEQIGWSESNAVIFANSILGARTQKYPDFLDVCIALTGRAPFYGCHTDAGRLPTLRIHVKGFDASNEVNWSLLGYCAGNLSGHGIPLITGIETLSPTLANLKNLCAAFGTTSSSSMLHITGITPGAVDTSLPIGLPVTKITADDLRRARISLSTAIDTSVQLISLGSPHLLLEEFAELVSLCSGKTKSPKVDFIITTNRHVYQQAASLGYVASIEQFGAAILTDTCWCMIEEPVVRKSVENIMTNSAKYAHYGTSLVKKSMHLGSLSDCVIAACVGSFSPLSSPADAECC